MDGGFDAISVGDSYETRGRTITEADVVNFAGVSGDFHRLHTDADSAADAAFGERIAHGALVFSVLTGLLWQSRSEAEREHIVAFYGVDRLRFVQPTRIGDTVHVEVEVTEKTERDHPVATGVVRQQVAAVTQDGTTVLSCELLLLVA